MRHPLAPEGFQIEHGIQQAHQKDIAHAAGVRVALHTLGPGAVPDALRAGVDSIEHPVGLENEILEEWSATDTIYVPTIDHNRYYADHRAEYGYDESIERALREFVQAPGDPRCLEFEKVNRVVNTASHAQVRRSIYTSAIDRYRVYESRLGPLIRALK